MNDDAIFAAIGTERDNIIERLQEVRAGIGCVSPETRALLNEECAKLEHQTQLLYTRSRDLGDALQKVGALSRLASALDTKSEAGVGVATDLAAAESKLTDARQIACAIALQLGTSK
jgi:predicted nucleic acid-binding protein